eukprot:gene17423-biopygen805
MNPDPNGRRHPNSCCGRNSCCGGHGPDADRTRAAPFLPVRF